MKPAQSDIDIPADAIPVPFKATRVTHEDGGLPHRNALLSWDHIPIRSASGKNEVAYFGCREFGRGVGIYRAVTEQAEVLSITRHGEGWRVAGGTNPDIHPTFIGAILDMFDQAAARNFDTTQAKTRFATRCDVLRKRLADYTLRIAGPNQEIIIEDISSPSPVVAINRPVSALYRTGRPIFKSREFLRTKMSYLVAGRHSFKVEISRSGDSLRTLPFGRRKPLYAKSLAEMHYKVMKSLAGADIPGASGHDRLAIAETARQLKITPPDFSYPLDPQPPEQEF